MKSIDRKLDSRNPAEVMEAIRRLMGCPATTGAPDRRAPTEPKRLNPWRWSAFAH